MKKLYEEENIQNIADSIRSKTGSTDKLKLADIPSKIDGIDLETYQKIIDRTITSVNLTNLTSVGSYGFNNCTSLTSINLPNLKSVGGGGFNYCTSLTEVNLPSLKSVGYTGFSYCTSLTSVNLTNLTSVGSYGFNNCTSLTSINLPNLKSVGGGGFSNCRKLIKLVMRIEQLVTIGNSNAFESTPIASGTGFIYVPSALVESYKTATNWSVYANQFRALEDYTVDGTITGELDESKI